MPLSESGSLNHGFLGSTSFAAVYAEDRSLGNLHTASPEQGRSNTSNLLQPDLDSHIKTGAMCLGFLRDMPRYDTLIRTWLVQKPLSMIAPWIAACESGVRMIHSRLEVTHQDQIEQVLIDYSTRVFENSFKPLALDKTCNLDQFADMITGQNIRWECVGMYFTAVGLAAMTVVEHQLGVSVKGERDSFDVRLRLGRNMLEASDACKALCERVGQLTDPESWLYMANSHLCTLVEGDASYSSWRRLGDLISITIAKGLHGEISPSETIPFWLSEMRKRQFAVCYNMDKSTSVFLGRPPRLSRRYCTMQLPLDLEARHFRLPDAQLEAEINKLDEAGWNTEGEFRSILYVRTNLICCMITEDIQELMLSTLPEHRAEYAQVILARAKSSWDSLPAFIKDAPKSPVSGIVQRYLPGVIKATFIHNQFLLQRLLVQQQKASNDELIQISRTELEIILELFRHHQSGTHNTVDMPWFIAKFALPAAGVLAFELLRQSQGQRVSSKFHRSEVVQNLSSLLAALKWATSKQAANFDICNYARMVLQQILDTVLSPRQETSHAMDEAHEAATAGTAHEYDLLGQSQSELEFWSLLPQHPLLKDQYI